MPEIRHFHIPGRPSPLRLVKRGSRIFRLVVNGQLVEAVVSSDGRRRVIGPVRLSGVTLQ